MHKNMEEMMMPEACKGQFLGSCYSIRSDWPDIQTEEEVTRRSRDSIRAFGTRCWSRKK